MTVDLQAVLIQVQVKPPKDVPDPPVMRLILEVEGTNGIETLARYIGKDVGVRVYSDQLSFEDLEAGEMVRAAKAALSPVGGVATEVSFSRGIDRETGEIG